MNRKDFYFKSSNGKTNIHTVEWTPDKEGQIKGIIQIAHGLNEHITMYEPIAKFFTDRFFIVRGNDHIGHGESVEKGLPTLYFGPKGSWHFAADDIYKLRSITRKEYGETPYIMLGFSLGSYLIRDYLIRYRETLDAAIIVGCIHVNAVANFFGKLLSNVSSLIYGDRKKSKLFEFITNGTSNKKIKSTKTSIDWLNSNQNEIQKLLHDPFAYGNITTGLFREMMGAVTFTNDKKNIAKMDKNIPILFISGKEDPLSDKGRTVDWLSGLFKEVGVKDVHTRIYPGRHRILFEEDQEFMLMDIYDWACSKLNTEHKDINEVYDDFDKYINKEKNIEVVKDTRVDNVKNKEFFLRTVKTDKAVTVTVEGSLNIITSPKLVDYCRGLSIDISTRNIVIDLQETEYIAKPGEEAIEELKKIYGDKLVILK